jgi:hypothetical protein
VIKVDFAGGSTRNRAELELRLGERLAVLQRDFEVALSATSIAGQFAKLIQVLVATTGAKAVVLVDEYDKPLLDNIGTPEVRGWNHDGLRDCCTVLKENGGQPQFVFLPAVERTLPIHWHNGCSFLDKSVYKPIDILLPPAAAAGPRKRPLRRVPANARCDRFPAANARCGGFSPPAAAAGPQ